MIEKLKNKRSKIIIGMIISLSALLVVYFGVAVYFMYHFYFGSEINSINISGKTVKEVNKLMAAELESYTLSIKERGDKTEQIKAVEVGLKYNSNGEFKSFKDKQNAFKWISAIFNTQGFKMTEGVTYDEALLKERLDKLSCFDSSNVIEPKNPTFKYEGSSYVIVDEVKGSKVDKDTLYKHLGDAILKRDTALDLEAIDCYVKPQYTSKSQKIIETKDKLNKLVSSKITYTFGERSEVVDGALINKWITVDENFEVKLDKDKAKSYVDGLANKYNSVGKAKNFVAASGKTMNVDGGDYGWAINTAKETQDLYESIQKGQTISKEPAYTRTALSYANNGIGNTYVEIDIAKQHLWFYKNGVLMAQGDVVTGNVSRGNGTPKGIYKLKYKQKNAVLRGPGYAAPVTFWMPFNNGIGIHDASWRNSFGGNIYRTNGSHGCVNSPYNLAKTIFDNISVGTPVICY